MVRCISLVVFSLFLSGCKLLLIVPQGGTVNAINSSTSCDRLTNCEFEIIDATFVEVFEALPNEGYQFKEWYEAPGFLCGGLQTPVCTVANGILEGLVPDSAIADGPDIYLMAVFTDKAPITDTIDAADGNEWAQPDLFNGLTFNAIEAICPLDANGVCDGSLKGWDMRGWQWADGAKTAALFSAYGITPPLDFETNAVATGCNASWLDAMVSDNWRATGEFGPYYLAGWVAEPPAGPTQVYSAIVSRLLAGVCGPGNTRDAARILPAIASPDTADPLGGAYFFRM